MKQPAQAWVVYGIASVAGLALVYLMGRGVRGAAKDAAGAVVNAAGGAAVGVVDATSSAVGLPTTDETTTDPRVARWIIDTYGWFEASKWSGVPALWSAASMDAGTGTPPPVGSALDRALRAKAQPVDLAGQDTTGAGGWNYF